MRISHDLRLGADNRLVAALQAIEMRRTWFVLVFACLVGWGFYGASLGWVSVGWTAGGMLAIVGTVGILGFATTIGLLGFWNRMPWVNVVHAVLVAGTMGSAILITGAAGNVALSVTVGVGEGAFAAGFNSAIALMAGLAMTLTCAWQLQAQRQ